MAIDLSALNDVLENKDIEQVLDLDIEKVKPDPNQPRKFFDEDKLIELAENIRDEGLIQPIVVKDADLLGHYQIIAGERRYRAMLLNGATKIRAVLGDQLSDYASLSENTKRDNLTLAEISEFISTRVALGENLTNIAKKMGWDKALVSKYAAWNSRPECIDKAHQSGIVDGVLNCYELIRLYKSFPSETQTWLDQMIEAQETITTKLIKLARVRFETPETVNIEMTTEVQEHIQTDRNIQAKAIVNQFDNTTPEQKPNVENSQPEPSAIQNQIPPHFADKEKAEKQKDETKFSKPVILCFVDGRECTLDYKQKPNTNGYVFVSYENGERSEVLAEKIQLNSIIEG